MEQLQHNPFINDFIRQKAAAERQTLKPISLALTANYVKAYLSLKRAIINLFEEDSHKIAITNLNQKRFKSNRFYVVHMSYEQLTLFEQFPTYEEKTSFSFLTGDTLVDGNLKDDNFTIGLFKRIQAVARDAKQQNAFLFHEPLDKKITEPILLNKNQKEELRLNGINDLFTNPALAIEMQRHLGKIDSFLEIIDLTITNRIINALSQSAEDIERLHQCIATLDFSALINDLKQDWVKYPELLL